MTCFANTFAQHFHASPQPHGQARRTLGLGCAFMYLSHRGKVGVLWSSPNV